MVKPNPPQGKDAAHPAPALPFLLAAFLARWPDMARYADTARLEPLVHAGGWCWGVTVTIFDSAAQAAERLE